VAVGILGLIGVVVAGVGVGFGVAVVVVVGVFVFVDVPKRRDVVDLACRPLFCVDRVG